MAALMAGPLSAQEDTSQAPLPLAGIPGEEQCCAAKAPVVDDKMLAEIPMPRVPDVVASNSARHAPVAEPGKHMALFASAGDDYSLRRNIGIGFAPRKRAGLEFSSGTRIYGTASIAHMSMDDRFGFAHGQNIFTRGADDDARGWMAGIGIDQRVDRHLSVGLLYRFNSLNGGDAPPLSFVNATEAERRYRYQSISLTADFDF